MSISSFVQGLRAQSHLSSFMLSVFLFLLLLLAFVLSVTVCVAVYRVLKYCTEAKRERQRRYILETALQSSITHQREQISVAAANMSIYSTNAHMANSIFGKLPSYDEALKMGKVLQKQQERRSRSSISNEPVQSAQNKLLRLAPQRPVGNRQTVAAVVDVQVEEEYWKQCKVPGADELACELATAARNSTFSGTTTTIEVLDFNGDT